MAQLARCYGGAAGLDLLHWIHEEVGIWWWRVCTAVLHRHAAPPLHSSNISLKTPGNKLSSGSFGSKGLWNTRMMRRERALLLQLAACAKGVGVVYRFLHLLLYHGEDTLSERGDWFEGETSSVNFNGWRRKQRREDFDVAEREEIKLSVAKCSVR